MVIIEGYEQCFTNRVIKECSECGKFSHRNQCSDECQDAYEKRYEQKRNGTGICRDCNDKIKSGMYCKECAEKRRIKGKVERNFKKRKFKVCLHCLKPLYVGGEHNRFCSDECKYNYNRPKRKAREIRADAKRRSYLKDYPLIDPEDIFDRDEYVCGLCGGMTDKDAVWDASNPPKRYPTIDHIIPLSKGGTHTEDNLQCACHTCNCSKSNKIK